MPIKINGATSGSTTITAPDSGGDESIELSTALASKLPYSYGTATPSTTDSGFLWYDSNSTPAAPKFWDGAAFQDFPSGLSLVASEDFTTVSAVSINGSFTAAYTHYKLVYRIGLSTNTSLVFRLRASGTDNTDSQYVYQELTGSGSTAAASSGTTDRGYLMAGANQSQYSGELNLYQPQIATQTYGQGIYRSNLQSAGVMSLIHGLASAFDGITVFPGTGTISGTFRIYGMKD